MSGQMALIIGFTGTGKSVLTRKLIKGKKCLVFDVNNEYTELSFDTSQPNSRFIGDYNEFVTKARNKRKCHVVFEDATGFFRGKANKETMQMIVRKRHDKNNYYFLFHSVQQVPKDLIFLSNIIILFRTNDIETDVRKKFPLLVNAFKRVNSKEQKKYEPVIIKLQ